MPTYNYRCTVCSKEQEHVHRMSETPVFTCCGKPAVRVPYPVRTTFKHADRTAWKDERKLMQPVRPRGV